MEETSPHLIPNPQNPSPTLDWIEDEDLLRDEGVIFGLSTAEPDEKTEVIRLYFAAQTATPYSLLRFLEQKIKSLERQISEKETEKQQLTEKKIYFLQVKPDTRSHLLRTSVGLVLALGVCVCNFYLILQVITPHFSEPVWVASGVFLAGMFSLFARTSFFFTDNQSVDKPWKIWFEELLMPVASTFFVSVWAFQVYSLVVAIAFSVFVLALFLISGKMLLSILTNIKTDMENFVTERRYFQNNRKMFRQTEVEISVIEVKLKDWELEKQQIPEQMSPFIAQIAQTEARRDMLIKIFESEFYLSRNYKSQLTDTQKQDLTTFKVKNG